MRRTALALLVLALATPQAAAAHGTGGGSGGRVGASFFLLLGGMAVAGAGLVNRRRLPRVAVVAAVIAGAALGISSLLAAGPSERPDVHIAVVAPTDGATVPAGKPVAVRVEVDAPLATGPADKQGGHLQLSVNGKLKQMPYSATTEVTLEPGRHRLTVEYVDNKHLAYDPPVAADVEVTAS
ncbi:MAG TPA: hypothetical protein VNB24_03690 [Acidimicrobiales bacterium]|nr:hypothetical protein [Acidimicrobiales bacterium]